MIHWEEEATKRGFASPRDLLYHWRWEADWTIRQIMDEMDVWCDGSIHRALKRFGIPPRRRGRRPQENRSTVLSWLREHRCECEGMTSEGIAQRLGTTRRYMITLLRELHIPYLKENSGVVRWRKCPRWRKGF